MNGRNGLIGKVSAAAVVVLAIGVVLLLVFWNQTALMLVEGPAGFLFSRDSGFARSVLFNVMAKEMKDLPQTLTLELVKGQEVVSVIHGSMDPEAGRLFEDFLTQTSDGQTAQIIFAAITTEGDPIYMNVLLQCGQYLAVVDNSRDMFRGEGAQYARLHYEYLKIILDPETGNSFVLLTNDSQLTFEQLRNAQTGSDMESIDAYQLFSFSTK